MVGIFKLILNFSYHWIDFNAHNNKLEKTLCVENRKTYGKSILGIQKHDSILSEDFVQNVFSPLLNNLDLDCDANCVYFVTQRVHYYCSISYSTKFSKCEQWQV